jgi:hypothetical protein
LGLRGRNAGRRAARGFEELRTIIIIVVTPIIAILQLAPRFLAAQEPFLSYDFASGPADFFSPSSVDFCGTVVSSGTATVQGGGLRLQNDASVGISIVTLRAAVVEEAFPVPRDYRFRFRFVLGETMNELNAVVRGRVGVSEVAGRVNSSLERSYAAVIGPGAFPAGGLVLVEFTGCHAPVPHLEWPGATAGEPFARVDPGFPIERLESYWIELSVEGEDNGGPVTLAARLWPDGSEPPLAPLVTVVDEDGLAHTAATLAPEAEHQIGFGTSLAVQAPSASCLIDDVTLTSLEEPPPPGVGPFLRGDCNQDGSNTGQVTDVVFLLNFLFSGGDPPVCRAACDMNSDGEVAASPTDAVFYLNFNFLGSEPLAQPLEACDLSATEGDLALGCGDPSGCMG